MHANLEVILTLTSGFAAALVLGYITHRVGLSPIVGYLLAGVAVGPNTPGLIADPGIAEQLAEVGVILLMFGVGLHFHWKELLAVRRIAVPGAVFQSLVATVLGILVALTFGWDWTAGIVYGLAIAVASTVVLVRVLTDNNDLHTPTGHIAVGWLVVEDLFTVVVLVLLPAVFGHQSAGPSAESPVAAHSPADRVEQPAEHTPAQPTAEQNAPAGNPAADLHEVNAASIAQALAIAAVKIGALCILVFVLGGRVIPWLLERIAATRSRELFTLTVLVVALGIAVGSAQVFGVSMALGAFLAGMVVGRSEFSLRAATEALPMRDAFAVLFFVSVGMLFDPRFLLESPLLVAATLGIVMLGKPLAALTIVVLLRYPMRVALAVAVALAQIGEFSFILVHLGRDLEIVPAAMTSVVVASAIVSISLNPLLYRMVDPLEAWAARRPRLGRWLKLQRTAASPAASAESAESPAEESLHDESRHQAIIVGYGPVGQTLCRLLRSNEIEPTVIEMNLETVQRLRGEGIATIYGDASHLETLQSAGIDRAETLILSASGLRNAREIIRLARERNRDVQVLVRAGYLRETPALAKAGADSVFSGEGEVALAMTESVLRDLGATAEQIDRERERVREDLFGILSTKASDLPLLPETAAAAPATDASAPGSPAGSAADQPAANEP